MRPFSLHTCGFLVLSTLGATSIGCGGDTSNGAKPTDAGAEAESGPPLPTWMTDARIFVDGFHSPIADNDACRTAYCRHSENTDMIRWKGAIYLVHRTAMSQILGPNSSLWIYRSIDDGKNFTTLATIPAPDKPLTVIAGDKPDAATAGRDLRDPCFYVVGDSLRIKALTRLPVTSARDAATDTIAVGMATTDGSTWSPMQAIGPTGYSFWRIKQQGSTYYNAAYMDGDKGVVLFSSTDGVNWTKGADVYTVTADTPLETELQFMPSGKLVAFVRMDGTDAELMGDQGRLRTKLCWANPPYSSFDCSTEFDGQRLDGPVSFMWNGRLFMIARRHLQPSQRKRTSLFEIKGTLEGGPLSINLIGDLPSAGDTSYAGVAPVGDHKMFVSWYSGDLVDDVPWFDGMLGPSNIWLGTIDLSKL